MKPGRELDALVAEKVMGLELIRHGPNIFYKEYGKFHPCELLLPEYSSFVGEAWLVVEKVEKEHYPFILTVDRYGGVYSGGRWLASFAVPMEVYEWGPLGDDVEAMGYWYNPGLICAGETPAQAICLAALRACGEEVQ